MSTRKKPLGILLIALALSAFVAGTQVQPFGVTALRVSLFAAAYFLWMIGLVVLLRSAKSATLNEGRGFLGVLLMGSSIGPFLLAMILLFVPAVSGFWALTGILVAGAVGLVGSVVLASGMWKSLQAP